MSKRAFGFHSRQQKLFVLFLLAIVGYLLVKVAILFSHSLIFTKKDRIQFAIVGKHTAYYSISLDDDRHYVLHLPADVKIEVPGGYGQYRVGSLNKLIQLEKNQDIVRKGFSLATSTFVDYYFYPSDSTVYYGSSEEEDFFRHNRSNILLYRSNANIIDRIYLFMLYTQAKDSTFTTLSYRQEIEALHENIIFNRDSYRKRAQGFMYQKALREENQTVQIIYHTHYKTASALSEILEGNGIWVSDISKGQSGETQKPCIVRFSNEYSETAEIISSFFSCIKVKGDTDVYDVQLELNEVEESWRLK